MVKSRDMELLRRVEDRGYPTEYLISRIRGRRTHLIADWKPLVLSASPVDYLPSTRYGDIMADNYPEGIWRFLLKELGWVYSRMNGALSEVFRPFFQYAELRTVFICLRYAGGGETGKIDRLLSLSLLSEKIKEILRGGNLLSAVRGIGDGFMSQSDRFSGLEKVFDEAGLPGAERFLSKVYLEYTAHSKLHPVMKDFFVSVIDSRNILSLYKYLILNATNIPYFINGGRISEKMFIRIAGKKEIPDIGALIRRFTGTKLEKTDATNIENALCGMVTRLLKRAGREPLGIGLILYYLWRCSLEARNLSILLYGGEIDRDILAAELAQ